MAICVLADRVGIPAAVLLPRKISLLPSPLASIRSRVNTKAVRVPSALIEGGSVGASRSCS